MGERGISVQLIAKHVYNQNLTLFSTPDLKEIHAYVQQYLLRNSKTAQSLVERTERRGFYRLNTSNSSDARQVMLEFREEENNVEEAQEEIKPQQDLSLSLFGDEF